MNVELDYGKEVKIKIKIVEVKNRKVGMKWPVIKNVIKKQKLNNGKIHTALAVVEVRL